MHGRIWTVLLYRRSLVVLIEVLNLFKITDVRANELNADGKSRRRAGAGISPTRVNTELSHGSGYFNKSE
jgi:hypothetical protein